MWKGGRPRPPGLGGAAGLLFLVLAGLATYAAWKQPGRVAGGMFGGPDEVAGRLGSEKLDIPPELGGILGGSDVWNPETVATWREALRPSPLLEPGGFELLLRGET